MKTFVVSLLLSVLALLAPPRAQAQTAPQAVLTWTAPTTYTDGTPIPSGTTMTFNVYQGSSTTASCSGITLSKVASVTALTDTINTGLVDGTTYCWSVTAVANGNESAQTTPIAKTFAAGTPGQVINLTVK